MLKFITNIIDIKPFAITCKFNDGTIRYIDLEEKIKKLASKSPQLFNKLLDFEFFKKVQIDSYGTLLWENGIDFCPDNLWEISQVIE